jgi:sarcosine oxidase subunit gamma
VSALALRVPEPRQRLGLKGPRAAQWLAEQGIALPTLPNTWARPEEAAATEALLVARLGATEFFLEDGSAGTTLERISPILDDHPPGVYPVMREDRAFVLSGDGVHEVLAQVCNVNFAALSLDSHPVIMTLMIGVAVLVVPHGAGENSGGAGRSALAGRYYRIWCDPTFGPYMGESLGAVVIDCGGSYTGVPG